jgi:site-specific recombinase XerD
MARRTTPLTTTHHRYRLMDLTQAAQAFSDHAIDSRRLSARSVSAYLGDLRAFAEWLNAVGLSLDVRSIEAAQIEDFMAACTDVSPSTIRRRLDAISSLYRFLVKRRLAGANPVDQVDRPRCPDSHRAYLTPAQMQRLLAVVQGSSECAVAGLLCFLALRRSEVVSLDCGDVDLAGGRLEIRQSKGGHSRTLPVPPELRPALEAHLAQRVGAPDAPLFLSQRGSRLSRSVLGRTFSKWLALAGLEGLGLSPHSCRHGCASRWLRSGLTIVEVQHLLGHRSVDVTGLYCHAEVDDIAASLGAKLTPLSQGRVASASAALPPGWDEVLSRLDAGQTAALLTVARSMVGQPVAADAAKGSTCCSSD